MVSDIYPGSMRNLRGLQKGWAVASDLRDLPSAVLKLDSGGGAFMGKGVCFNLTAFPGTLGSLFTVYTVPWGFPDFQDSSSTPAIRIDPSEF